MLRRADIYTFLWCYGFSLHSEVMPNCEKAAKKASELAPDLASAHTALGIVLLGQRNWDEAEHQLRLATELDKAWTTAIPTENIGSA